MSRESNKLAAEAEAMTRRLNELRNVLETQKATQRSQGGRIWSSSSDKKPAGKSGGRRQKSSEGTSKPATPASNMSTQAISRPDATTTPPPASFNLFGGAFSQDEQAAVVDDVTNYLDDARTSHAEDFSEIDSWTYSEEEERKSAFEAAKLQQQRNNTVEAADSVPIKRPTVSFAEPSKGKVKMSSETSTSPEPSPRPQCDGGMQTDLRTPDPRWNSFVHGLRDATTKSYFDHLLSQLSLIELQAS
eukprot:TRINITY_DN20803_c0_g1_i1.p1 TRINITY_DN20803_c0_g1~~TRINITY_DN20803_c0_g1_i1.p1  ORF type:complete len:246 (+),score=32.35 TRINITY_DN20803_c0_g1_i1:57-794(+)